jgi:hypothetical protein
LAFGDLLARVDFTARRQLGGDVVYAPGIGTPVTVRGVFDKAYQLVPLDAPGISSTAPAVFLRGEDLPSSPLNDVSASVTAGGVVYRIREVRPDGLGGMLLILHEA